jgi:hypothetical protein
MTVKRIKLLLVLLLMSSFGFAQSGGNNTFDFLTLYNSPRNAALGSNFLSVNDDDVELTISNPALIGDFVHNSISLSVVDFYSDIAYGYAAYGRSFEKFGNFVGAIQYINYGEFDRLDAQGIDHGTFSAGEYAFNVGWGRMLSDRWNLGANAKVIYSSLEDYKSFGLAVDVAMNYHSEDKLFSSSLIFRNVGRQISAYDETTERLPFNIQLAFSKRLEKAPFRFHLVLNHLNKWDLFYEDPYDPDYIENSFDGTIPGKTNFEKFQENLLRHVIVGVELIPVKAFSVQVSYNYLQRQEMKIRSAGGMTGFSAGFGIKVKKFRLNYARSQYHIHGSPNLISISTKF